MKKAFLIASLGLAFLGTVGCSSAPVSDIDDAAPAAASAQADSAPAPIADMPQSEPIASSSASVPAPPYVAEPPMAKSPSLGASSSGRGH